MKYIASRSSSFSLKKQPRRLPCPGVNLEFQQSAAGIKDSHVDLEFKKMEGKSESVRRAQKRLVSVLTDLEESGTGDVASDDDNEKREVEKGDEFICDAACWNCG